MNKVKTTVGIIHDVYRRETNSGDALDVCVGNKVLTTLDAEQQLALLLAYTSETEVMIDHSQYKKWPTETIWTVTEVF